MKIKTGDTVLVISGKDSGRSAKVARVLPRENKVVIDGLNLRKKHQRPRKGGEKGNIVTLPHPLSAANVKVICPSCKRPARLGYFQNGEAKQRICKKCKAIIS